MLISAETYDIFSRPILDGNAILPIVEKEALNLGLE
jgi:hypothetical protein